MSEMQEQREISLIFVVLCSLNARLQALLFLAARQSSTFELGGDINWRWRKEHQAALHQRPWRLRVQLLFLRLHVPQSIA